MSQARSRGGRLVELGVVVILLVGSAWLGRLLVHNYVTHGTEPPAPGLRFAPASVATTTLGGEEAELQVLDQDRRLLLLVLSTDCPFCERNMPNWVDLVERLPAAEAGGPRVLVLSVSPASVTATYLREHGLEVPVRLIDPDTLESLGLDGYPGTVTIEPASRELRPYAGVLDEADVAAIVEWSSADAMMASAVETVR